MSSLVFKTENIESKVKQLVLKNERLELMLGAKEETINQLQNKIKELELVKSEMEEKNMSLKTANAILGSNDYKTKTKLRINTLVREIDHCIAQLT
jgi:hypothetical protein